LQSPCACRQSPGSRENVFTGLIFIGRNMMIVVIAATNMSSENRIMNARTINKIEFVYRVGRFGFLLALGVLTLTALFTTAAPVKTDEHSNPKIGRASCR